MSLTFKGPTNVSFTFLQGYKRSPPLKKLATFLSFQGYKIETKNIKLCFCTLLGVQKQRSKNVFLAPSRGLKIEIPKNHQKSFFIPLQAYKITKKCENYTLPGV